MQSVSDVQKKLLEKPRFELAEKGVGLGYSDWEDVTASGRACQVFGPANRQSSATDG